MSEDIEMLAPGIEAAGAATALRWIAESNLDPADRTVLQELIEGFPDLHFARETPEALDRFEARLGMAVPGWLRAIRATMASPVGDPGPLRLEVDLPCLDPWAQGPWTVFPLRGASDETERALVTQAGVIPVGYGSVGDSQVLAVPAEGGDRTLLCYDVEDTTSDDPLVPRTVLADYLFLFTRTRAIRVGGETIGRRETPDGPGPGMRFFSELTGREVDEAAADPRGTLIGGLQALARELGPIAGGHASDDPEEQRRAADQADALRARLQRHQETGTSSTAAQEAAKERFQQRLGVNLRDAVERLQALRDEVAGEHGREPDQEHGESSEAKDDQREA